MHDKNLPMESEKEDLKLTESAPVRPEIDESINIKLDLQNPFLCRHHDKEDKRQTCQEELKSRRPRS